MPGTSKNTSKNQRKNKRKEKVGDLLQRALAEFFLGKVDDPRLKMLTITGVDVTGDLSHATVHFSMGDESQIKETLQALEKAQGFISHSLAEKLGDQLRIMPKLQFKYDNAIAYGEKMSKLIQEANEEANKVADTEANKAADTEANKAADTEANKAADTEANNEADTEANNEADTEANKAADTEANNEADEDEE